MLSCQWGDYINTLDAGIKLKVHAPDGLSSREYTVTVLVHKQDPDSLVWNEMTPFSTTRISGKQQVVTLGNELLVYTATQLFRAQLPLASSWSEEYQARLYEDNIEMFRHIPNLAGVSPWILFDFRSPYRFHPTNQEDWNRKGLVSDQGYRKAAWYIMRDYYEEIKNTDK